MARENRLWGAARIRGDLLTLGLRVGKRTVQRDRRGVRPPRRSGQTWATFLSTHAHEIWACDFLPVIDVGFRTLYAFFIVDLGSRRVVHVGVTRHPTDYDGYKVHLTTFNGRYVRLASVLGAHITSPKACGTLPISSGV